MSGVAFPDCNVVIPSNRLDIVYVALSKVPDDLSEYNASLQ